MAEDSPTITRTKSDRSAYFRARHQTKTINEQSRRRSLLTYYALRNTQPKPNSILVKMCESRGENVAEEIQKWRVHLGLE